VYVLLCTYTALRLSQICGGLCQTRKTPTLGKQVYRYIVVVEKSGFFYVCKNTSVEAFAIDVVILNDPSPRSVEGEHAYHFTVHKCVNRATKAIFCHSALTID
jgi:hypothetical protein